MKFKNVKSDNWGRVLAWLIAGSVVFAGCKPKAQPLGIEETKLVEILVEIHLAEGQMEIVNMADRDTLGKRLYQSVLDAHGVQREVFDETMLVLREDPERLNTIYTKVLDQLVVLDSKYK